MRTAILKGVRDHLRYRLNRDFKTVGVRPGPEPPPACGQEFISIHLSSWSPGPSNRADRAIDELFQFTITISHRIGYAPYDTWDDQPYLDEMAGIDRLSRQIVTLIHDNTDLMKLLNFNLITPENPSPQSFLEPMRWAGGDPTPREVDASWFTAQFNSPNDSQIAGLAQDLIFGELRRAQSVGSMF